MLYIIGKDTGKTWTWHVGEKINALINIHQIDQLQADCDELVYIQKMFPAFTPRYRQVAHFYGDIARTILLNLGRLTTLDKSS